MSNRGLRLITILMSNLTTLLLTSQSKDYHQPITPKKTFLNHGLTIFILTTNKMKGPGGSDCIALTKMRQRGECQTQKHAIFTRGFTTESQHQSTETS